VATLVGADDLVRALIGARRDLERDDRAGPATARRLAADGRRLAPARTGRLRRAIQVRGNTVEFGDTRVTWAAPINKGTSNRPQGGSNRPTGFIDRAVAAADEYAADIYDAAVDEALARNGLS
jgi:hypothetical protein